MLKIYTCCDVTIKTGNESNNGIQLFRSQLEVRNLLFWCYNLNCSWKQYSINLLIFFINEVLVMQLLFKMQLIKEFKFLSETIMAKIIVF